MIRHSWIYLLLILSTAIPVFAEEENPDIQCRILMKNNIELEDCKLLQSYQIKSIEIDSTGKKLISMKPIYRPIENSFSLFTEPGLSLLYGRGSDDYIRSAGVDPYGLIRVTESDAKFLEPFFTTNLIEYRNYQSGNPYRDTYFFIGLTSGILIDKQLSLEGAGLSEIPGGMAGISLGIIKGKHKAGFTFGIATKRTNVLMNPYYIKDFYHPLLWSEVEALDDFTKTIPNIPLSSDLATLLILKDPVMTKEVYGKYSVMGITYSYRF